ncbi:MAG: hypothetical protein ABF990_12845, partial [Acetobacter sp.]
MSADAPAWSVQPGTAGPSLLLNGSWTVRGGGMTPFGADSLDHEQGQGHALRVDATGLKDWDSALISFLWGAKQAAAHAGLEFDATALPAPAQRLLALLPPNPARAFQNIGAAAFGWVLWA